jgi:hypothetical protein
MRQIGLAILVLFCVSVSACEEDIAVPVEFPHRIDKMERWKVTDVRSSSCAIQGEDDRPSVVASGTSTPCCKSEGEIPGCIVFVTRPSGDSFSYVFIGHNEEEVKCSLARPGDTLVVTGTKWRIDEYHNGHLESVFKETRYEIQKIEHGRS